MKSFYYGAMLCALAACSIASPDAAALSPVQSNKLRRLMTRSALLEHSKTLEGFAYSVPERNRLFGGPGHNKTVNYLHDTLAALGDYYNIEYQPFTEVYNDGSANFTVGGVSQGASLMTYAPSGKVDSELIPVANKGCTAADYPATVSGKIAFISRGECEFGLKSALAGKAGALGAVIYNNGAGSLSGTLGPPPRAEGPYVPTAGIAQSNATAILDAIKDGQTVTGSLSVLSISEQRLTYNVIAQTKAGDQDNVLVVGAHTDSVAAGPGINDNGSGTLGILEVAIQLAKFSVKNAIRFTWFSAEEEGLLGSKYYVKSLSAAEREKVRLYLNFDMIASPNYVYGIYDGDGSSFNKTGPPGSAEAEKLFQDYFKNEAHLPYTSSEFSGRSDYGPFLEAGIACGGLDTGAEKIKTEEEAKIFGGKAGIAYDINYHGKGDNVANLHMGAFIHNTKAIAHAVATYATSFASLPPKAPAVPRPKILELTKPHTHDVGNGGCAHAERSSL